MWATYVAHSYKGGIPMKVSDETMLFRKVDDEPMTAEEVLTRV